MTTTTSIEPTSHPCACIPPPSPTPPPPSPPPTTTTTTTTTKDDDYQSSPSSSRRPTIAPPHPTLTHPQRPRRKHAQETIHLRHALRPILMPTRVDQKVYARAPTRAHPSTHHARARRAPPVCRVDTVKHTAQRNHHPWHRAPYDDARVRDRQTDARKTKRHPCHGVPTSWVCMGKQYKTIRNHIRGFRDTRRGSRASLVVARRRSRVIATRRCRARVVSVTRRADRDTRGWCRCGADRDD
jgi:hypothetical protein